MKFLQHILSKGLLIAIAILAALGYHFRATLFPQWFSASESEEKSAPRAQLDSSGGPADVPPAPPPVAAVPAPAQTEVPAAVQAQTAVPQPMAPQPSTQAAPLEMPANASMTTNAAAPQSNAAGTDSATAAVDAQGMSLLDSARAAFWSRDFERAEQLYKQLADQDATSADALGELGNIYYSQGRWTEAADAYAGAVTRLSNIGDIPRAQHLLMVLDGLDPSRARSIRESGVVGGG